MELTAMAQQRIRPEELKDAERAAQVGKKEDAVVQEMVEVRWASGPLSDGCLGFHPPPF